jgi:hypothetical protein
VVLTVAGAAAVGAAAFNAGVERGLVEASRTASLPEAATHVYVLSGPGHGGFFPIVPLVLGFLFVVFLVRGLGWRGRGGCGPRQGVPPAFDEWHRRAHERMGGPPPAPDRTA